MRVLIHYLSAIIIMTVYGGQVCPYVEGLGISDWLVEITIFFIVAFIIRTVGVKLFVNRSAYHHQVNRQLVFDFSIFVAVGVVLTIYNNIVFDFPLDSGLKMLLGSASLGFFEAVDVSLARERQISVLFARTGQEMMLKEKYFPMTGKFALVASVCAVAVAGVMILVIIKDLDWIIGQASSGHLAKRSVIIEILFIMAIFLAEIFNLIFSYARNLKMFVGNQNRALMIVAGGDLSSHVPVSTNDEFGYMAAYTNQMIESLRDRTEELQLTRDVTILSLASLAETRDNETGAHILRTQRYVRALAQQLKNHARFKEYLDPDSTELLYKSAPLHDIGKVGVADAILLKPGKHTPEEFEEMKKHTTLGRDALQAAIDRLGTSSFLKLAQEIAYTHHEKWNGTGYPQSLKADKIPISGRLMALADVYDALITKRVYKPAFPHQKAKDIILEGRGEHFDADIVDAFLSIEDEFVQIAKEFADSEHESAENEISPPA